jgi:hypothetical protein
MQGKANAAGKQPNKPTSACGDKKNRIKPEPPEAHTDIHTAS